MAASNPYSGGMPPTVAKATPCGTRMMPRPVWPQAIAAARCGRLTSGNIFIDVASAHQLAREARRRRGIGHGLYLLTPKENVPDMRQSRGHLEKIGAENTFRLGNDVIDLRRETVKSGADHSISTGAA